MFRHFISGVCTQETQSYSSTDCDERDDGFFFFSSLVQMILSIKMAFISPRRKRTRQRRRTKKTRRKSFSLFDTENNIQNSRLLIVTMALYRRLDVISATLTMRTRIANAISNCYRHTQRASLYE